MNNFELMDLFTLAFFEKRQLKGQLKIFYFLFLKINKADRIGFQLQNLHF